MGSEMCIRDSTNCVKDVAFKSKCVSCVARPIVVGIVMDPGLVVVSSSRTNIDPHPRNSFGQRHRLVQTQSPVQDDVVCKNRSSLVFVVLD